MRKLFFISLLLFAGISWLSAQDNKAEEYFKKANEYFDKDEYANAIPYCDSTLMANPEHTEAFAFRGVCKYNLKLYKEAIEDFNLALILVPGYAEVYFFRGLCYKELNDNDKACSDWMEAYSLGLKKAMKMMMVHCQDMLEKE